ncbi:MAG TPA: VCBS repeat-containing protein, partial [Polyangiaceae bacterium]
MCAALNGLGVDTTKTPRVGPNGSPLPASFNPFGGKVTALYPKQELYIGGLKLAGTSKTSAIVERHADKSGEPANNVMFQAADDWTTAALHTAVAGDFDGNGRQEIIALYVEDGSIWLHSIGDENSKFATQDVLLGKYDVSALSAIAGDFDGDGKDQLAIAIAQTTGTKLLFAGDAGTLFKIDDAQTKSIARDTAGSTLSFRLAVGNFDYDPAKELVLVTNEAVGAFDAGQGSAHYFVYDDQGTKFLAQKDGYVQGKDGSLYSALVAAPAVIDVDADGVGEVLLAGLVSHDFSGPVEMILLALDDAAHQFSAIAAKHTSDYRDLSDQTSVPQYQSIVINGLDLDGDLAADIQVNQTVFSNFAKSKAPFSKLYEIDGQEFQGKSSFQFRADNATIAVGDFNGDKHDDIVALSSDRSKLNIWGYQSLGASKQPIFGKIDSVAVEQTQMDWKGTPMLVPVNVDDDTSLLSFTEAKSDFVFTEPLVIAAIAAPPCQSEIGQLLDVCQTSFGTAQTQQVSKENAVTLSASVSVGVSFEDRTFTQSAIEIEATATVAATATRGTSYSLEKSVTFTTGSMEDGVVFTTIPYDRYTYTIISDPRPELVGQTTTISVPREPVTLMVERSF